MSENSDELDNVNRDLEALRAELSKYPANPGNSDESRTLSLDGSFKELVGELLKYELYENPSSLLEGQFNNLVELLDPNTRLSVALAQSLKILIEASKDEKNFVIPSSPYKDPLNLVSGWPLSVRRIDKLIDNVSNNYAYYEEFLHPRWADFAKEAPSAEISSAEELPSGGLEQAKQLISNLIILAAGPKYLREEYLHGTHHENGVNHGQDMQNQNLAGYLRELSLDIIRQIQDRPPQTQGQELLRSARYAVIAMEWLIGDLEMGVSRPYSAEMADFALSSLTNSFPCLRLNQEQSKEIILQAKTALLAATPAEEHPGNITERYIYVAEREHKLAEFKLNRLLDDLPPTAHDFRTAVQKVKVALAKNCLPRLVMAVASLNMQSLGNIAIEEGTKKRIEYIMKVFDPIKAMDMGNTRAGSGIREANAGVWEM